MAIRLGFRGGRRRPPGDLVRHSRPRVACCLLRNALFVYYDAILRRSFKSPRSVLWNEQPRYSRDSRRLLRTRYSLDRDGSNDMRLGIAAMLLAGVLISYHSFTFDCLVVLPAALLLLEQIVTPVYMIEGALLLCPFMYILPMVGIRRPLAHVATLFLVVLATIAARVV